VEPVLGVVGIGSEGGATGSELDGAVGGVGGVGLPSEAGIVDGEGESGWALAERGADGYEEAAGGGAGVGREEEGGGNEGETGDPGAGGCDGGGSASTGGTRAGSRREADDGENGEAMLRGERGEGFEIEAQGACAPGGSGAPGAAERAGVDEAEECVDDEEAGGLMGEDGGVEVLEAVGVEEEAGCLGGVIENGAVSGCGELAEDGLGEGRDGPDVREEDVKAGWRGGVAGECRGRALSEGFGGGVVGEEEDLRG
jgi:hypothetical protein